MLPRRPRHRAAVPAGQAPSGRGEYRLAQASPAGDAAARNYDQVEISRTDEFFLGIDAPIRESGNIAGSPGIILEGPNGTVQIHEGVIQAWRHIHMHPDDAAMFGVHDKDIVSVDVEDKDRPLTFKNVLIRVSDKFKLEMHIDTDEGNAAQIHSGEEGVLELGNVSCQLHEKNI